MNCKDCVHKIVCKHKDEADRIEEQMPKTSIPFKSTVHCEHYRMETANIRNPYAPNLTGRRE